MTADLVREVFVRRELDKLSCLFEVRTSSPDIQCGVVECSIVGAWKHAVKMITEAHVTYKGLISVVSRSCHCGIDGLGSGEAG